MKIAVAITIIGLAGMIVGMIIYQSFTPKLACGVAITEQIAVLEAEAGLPEGHRVTCNSDECVMTMKPVAPLIAEGIE